MANTWSISHMASTWSGSHMVGQSQGVHVVGQSHGEHVVAQSRGSAVTWRTRGSVVKWRAGVWLVRLASWPAAWSSGSPCSGCSGGLAVCLLPGLIVCVVWLFCLLWLICLVLLVPWGMVDFRPGPALNFCALNKHSNLINSSIPACLPGVMVVSTSRLDETNLTELILAKNFDRQNFDVSDISPKFKIGPKGQKSVHRVCEDNKHSALRRTPQPYALLPLPKIRSHGEHVAVQSHGQHVVDPNLPSRKKLRLQANMHKL